jgi:hypothetical protein
MEGGWLWQCEWFLYKCSFYVLNLCFFLFMQLCPFNTRFLQSTDFLITYIYALNYTGLLCHAITNTTTPGLSNPRPVRLCNAVRGHICQLTYMIYYYTILLNTITITFFTGTTAYSGPGLIIIEASWSHSDTSHSVGLLWTSDQPGPQTSTWLHNIHKRQISMLSAGFEPEIPASKRLQTHSLDCAALPLYSILLLLLLLLLILLLLLLLYTIYVIWGTAVAQWLRYCATNHKVAGSIPDDVIGILYWHKSFWSHHGPGVDSDSNRNEYQDYFPGVNAAGA